MIKLKKDAKQIELVKAIGSKNKSESLAAQEAFAAAVGPVISKVLMQLGTASLIYQDWEYGEDESPIFPLDFYYGEGVGAVSIWSAAKAGGLPSNFIESSGELRFTTYFLDSAINFDKKYARKTFAFNVLSKAVERMINEILIKQERQGWATILRALGEARSFGADHIIQANVANRLVVDDFSRLITLHKRINQSYAAGTPQSVFSNGPTDLFISPEIEQEIRGMAYNPQNTVPGPTVAGSTLSSYTATTAVPLPEAIRTEIYKNAGASSIYGKNFTTLNELGNSQKYNVLFGQYAPASIAVGGGNFSVSADEVIVAVDLTKGAFIRPVKSDGSANLVVSPDDQFLARSEKVGFYTGLEEGRVCLDGRAISAIIV
jgi:hypothetical protein